MTVLKAAVDNDHAVNAALINPNQAGTISETHKVLRAAKEQSWGTIVSARSSEYEDTTIADLSIVCTVHNQRSVPSPVRNIWLSGTRSYALKKNLQLTQFIKDAQHWDCLKETCTVVRSAE